MDEDLREMIEGFVEDSREAFDSMEEDLIAMEESPDDPSIMNNLFRVMHTLKGTAGFMGLTEISALSHRLESVFDLVRQEKMTMTPSGRERSLEEFHNMFEKQGLQVVERSLTPNNINLIQLKLA